jgi:hypothetical protein
LFAQIVLFDYIYPGYREQIPAWVRADFARRLHPGSADVQTSVCRGTLLSAAQFLDDVAGEFHDPRCQPLGNLTADQIAAWSANFIRA